MIRICPHCRESYSYAHTCPSGSVPKCVMCGQPSVHSFPDANCKGGMAHVCEYHKTRYSEGGTLTCVHGQLARQCLTCEHNREIAVLKEQVRLLTGRLRDVQRAMQGWPS